MKNVPNLLVLVDFLEVFEKVNWSKLSKILKVTGIKCMENTKKYKDHTKQPVREP